MIEDKLTKVDKERMRKVPENKKEAFYFGIMMCFGMVVIMTFYNFAINGLIGKMTFMEGLISFVSGFVVALILDFLIVGPLAKKIAFMLPFDKTNKVYVVIMISTCMVIGMASCMSFYGFMVSYFNNSLTGDSLITSYLSIFIKNFVVAYPLQLIIMGPIVRGIFVKFIKSNKQTKLAGLNV